MLVEYNCVFLTSIRRTLKTSLVFQFLTRFPSIASIAFYHQRKIPVEVLSLRALHCSPREVKTHDHAIITTIKLFSTRSITLGTKCIEMSHTSVSSLLSA